MKNEILLVEDDSSLATSLERVLALAGYGVTVATCGEVGCERADENRFAAVVTDFKLPGLSGLDLVKQIHAANGRVPIILMTAHGTAELAIEATKWGAYDYLLKPFEMPDLLAMIADAVAHNALSANPIEVSNRQAPPSALIGNSVAMQAIYKEIGRVAATSATVLIQGESGTGKELVARAIWQYSSRAMQPFVAVNCTSIPETLVESEMFGHERGAFTGAEARRMGRFEQAHKGTIFLDEIGDMTLPTQAKLLRVLQEKSLQRVGGREPISIDVRIIAATHRDLKIAIKEKQFREDLFYRLNVVCITLPPLRNRPEDIPELVRYFLRQQSAEMGIDKPSIQDEALQFLQQQRWYGNVRELESALRRALLVTPGYPITLKDVRRAMLASAGPGAKNEQSLSVLVKENLSRAQRGEAVEVYAELVGTLERELFAQAMELASGNQLRAARWLGISRLTLRHRLQKLGLAPEKFSGA
jgi:two-component system, NtrC family, response regulator